jgi:hypothetical protein
MPGGKHQAGVDPGSVSLGTVGLLLLFAELQRSHAEVRQRQRRLGWFGLGLTADELAADPLDLLADVQLGGVKVDRLPGEPE